MDVITMKDILKELSDVPGISGHEDAIRHTIKNKIKKYADEIHEDKMGNLVAVVKGNKKGLKILLSAHMDQIGFIVNHMEDKYIKVTPIGGISEKITPMTPVKIHTKKREINGVIVCKGPFFEEADESKKVTKLKELFIDIGLIVKEKKDKNKEEDLLLQHGIEIGDQITFDVPFVELQDNSVRGTAFDDRAGCAVLIEAIKNIGNNFSGEAHFLFATQEEVGLKGSRTAAFGINPDIALVVDTTSTGDMPGITKADSSTILGKGPIVTLADAEGRGLLIRKNIKEWLVGTAKNNKIKHQLEIGLRFGTTDATIINMSREGIPTGLISIPGRHIHSPTEIVNIDDLKGAAKLIVASIKSAETCF
ncbi:MAG: M20/M25/M40 family metallo-hydrolase [Candidatus Aenigmarchaeota archaeon]|nr:M20/M25/M40 family metallo-hydrolase [Candidatus Aenigmarchaeota archaeon]